MRWAAVESPYGPAPTTTASYGAAGTDWRGIFVSFTKLTRLAPERGRLSPQHLAQRGTREIGGGSRGRKHVLPIRVTLSHRAAGPGGPRLEHPGERAAPPSPPPPGRGGAPRR